MQTNSHSICGGGPTFRDRQFLEGEGITPDIEIRASAQNLMTREPILEKTHQSFDNTYQKMSSRKKR